MRSLISAAALTLAVSWPLVLHGQSLVDADGDRPWGVFWSKNAISYQIVLKGAQANEALREIALNAKAGRSSNVTFQIEAVDAYSMVEARRHAFRLLREAREALEAHGASTEIAWVSFSSVCDLSVPRKPGPLPLVRARFRVGDSWL